MSMLLLLFLTPFSDLVGSMFLIALRRLFVSAFDILAKNFCIIHFFMYRFLFWSFGSSFDFNFHAIDKLSWWDVDQCFGVFFFLGGKKLLIAFFKLSELIDINNSDHMF